MFLLSPVQLSVLACSEVQNTMQPIHLVDLRRPSLRDLTWRVLELTRSPTHLLMQQPIPRTHVQLEESFTCQIRVVLVELRVSFAITQDQRHTINCMLRTHTFITQCAQCAPTSLMAATPMRTTSKPNTKTISCHSRQFLPNFAKVGRKPVGWSTE